MEKTIQTKVRRHEDLIAREVFGTPLSSAILVHIIADKCRNSANATIAPKATLNP